MTYTFVASNTGGADIKYDLSDDLEIEENMEVSLVNGQLTSKASYTAIDDTTVPNQDGNGLFCSGQSQRPDRRQGMQGG